MVVGPGGDRLGDVWPLSELMGGGFCCFFSRRVGIGGNVRLPRLQGLGLASEPRRGGPQPASRLQYMVQLHLYICTVIAGAR